MKRFRQVTTGLVVVVVLAAPSVASAHSDASVGSVRAHVRGADQALAMVADAVANQDQAATAVAMVQNRRQTQAATRDTARIRGRAKQAKALRLVAAQRDENAQVLTGLLEKVDSALQADVATALTNNLSGRETAIAKLTALAPMLPAAAQVGIARAIAAISGRGASAVADITAAVKSGQIGAGALPQVQQALSIASGAMFMGIAQLQQIVGSLPGPAQGPVNDAIARVTGILQGIFGTGGPAGGAVPANLPIPASLPIPCGLPIPSFLPFAKAC